MGEYNVEESDRGLILRSVMLFSWTNCTKLSKTLFKWFIPVVCDYKIKYQKISGGWVKTQHFITV